MADDGLEEVGRREVQPPVIEHREDAIGRLQVRSGDGDHQAALDDELRQSDTPRLR